MNTKTYTLLAAFFIAALATACDRGSVEQPDLPRDPGESPRAIEDAAAAPTITSRPTSSPEATNTVEAIGTVEEATGTPPPAATAVEEPETENGLDSDPLNAPSMLYVQDGNPCVRDVFVPPIPTLGGGGEEVIRFDRVEAEDSPLVLSKLPQEAIVDGVYFVDAGGRLVVTYARREGIRIWDADSQEELAHLQGERSLLRPVLSRDGGLLAAADSQGQVWLWDLNQMEEDSGRLFIDLGMDEFYGSRVREIALSPDGRLLAIAEDREITEGRFTAARWGVARIFDTDSGEELGRFEGDMIGEVQVAEGLDDMGSEFWEAVEETVPAVMQNGHAGPIDWLAFSPDSRYLFTGNLDNGYSLSRIEMYGTEGTIRIWDSVTGEHLRCIEIGNLDDATDPTLSPDGLEIAAESGKSLIIWDVAAGEESRRFALPEVLDLEIGELIYSPDGGSLITTTGKEKTLRIWDSETGRLTGLLRHPDDVNAAAASQDGQRIAAGFGSRSLVDGMESGGTWVWNAAHPAIALAAQAQALVEAGLEAAQQGDMQGALLAFEEAQNLVSDEAGEVRGTLLRPAILEKACRFGSLGGNGAEALAVCELALAEATAAAYDDLNLVQYYDSRGLARALTGDIEGAIADFEFYVGQFDTDGFWVPDPVRRRQDWIAALRGGFDPFDERTLEALRDE